MRHRIRKDHGECHGSFLITFDMVDLICKKGLKGDNG